MHFQPLEIIFGLLIITATLVDAQTVASSARPSDITTTPSNNKTELVLTKIRLSDFYPSNAAAAAAQPPAHVARLLLLTDAHKFTYNVFDPYQSIGAVNVALKRLAAENVLNTSLIDLEIAHVTVTDRSCFGGAGDLQAIQHVYYGLQYKFDAVIGPPCGDGVLAVSTFAESLQKPHILFTAAPPEINNKIRYPYVTQNSIAPDKVAECMVELLHQLGNWTRIAYLYESDDYICTNLARLSVKAFLSQNTTNLTISYTAGFSGINSTDEHIQSILLEAAKVARIFLSCSSATVEVTKFNANVQQYDVFNLRLLSQAFVLGMHSGEYHFMLERPLLANHQIPPYAPERIKNVKGVFESPYSLQPIIDSLKLPVTETQLYEIFRSVLDFDQYYGEDEPSFDSDVISAGFLPPWNTDRDKFNALVKSGALSGHASGYSTYLADGIYLYGRGVRNAIDAGVDYGNSAVMRHIFTNISFQGKTGSFAINNDGKRLSDMMMYGAVKDFYSVHPLKRFERRGVMRCASLSAAERATGKTGRLDLITPLQWYGALNNRAPPDTPVCGWKNEHCQHLSTTGIVLLSCAAAFIVLVCFAIAYYFIRRRRRLAALLNTDWNLQPSDITYPKSNTRINSSSRHTMQSQTSSAIIKLDENEEIDATSIARSRSTLVTFDHHSGSTIGAARRRAAGLFRGKLSVFVKPVTIKSDKNQVNAAISVATFSIQRLIELRAMKDADHDNLNRFVGLIVAAENSNAPTALVVTGFCAKGSLASVLYGSEDDAAPPQPLDNLFKYWFINDIANGLDYLHNLSALKWHGRLSSASIVLDARWTAKISDFGYWSFGAHCSMNSWLTAQNRKKSAEKLFWTAPEVLREPEILLENGESVDSKHRYEVKAKQSADIYSLGIVMSEITYQVLPYRNHVGDFHGNSTADGILSMLMKPSSGFDDEVRIRPQQVSDFLDEYQNKTKRFSTIAANSETSQLLETAKSVLVLMTDCWQEKPSNRPTVRQIVRRLAKMNKSGSKSIMDRIINKLEAYAENLENIVQDRTSELMDEKQRADTLLSRMLPISVAERLKSGEPVVPEHFQECTIFFSDIVSFTTISSASTPMEVVQLLNDLYTFMDGTLDRFAPHVYKVETIGDAYMIVSGVPLRTHLHARILCSVALAILAKIEEAVRLPEKLLLLRAPDDTTTSSLQAIPNKVRLRVGLNSGPCVAGVVGLQMPRYCLFGDTVNVASRMESNGEAMRIHISESTGEALREWSEFVVEDRGVVQIKGKGEMRTHWLLDGPQSLNTVVF